MQLSRHPPMTPLSLDFEIQDSPLIFGFMLAGSNHCTYSHGSLRGTTRLHTCGGMLRLSILVEREFLFPYVAEAPASIIPKQLEYALEGRKTAFQWAGKHSARKRRLLADIVTSAYAGPLHNLHREIRTLELIETQLTEYLAGDSSRERTAPLSPSDIRHIKEAREILVRDMENPPTLARLARMAGIGEKN